MRAEQIRKLIATLNEAGVQHLIVGGYAVIAHGYGRFTSDLDLVVRLERENILKAFEALATLGYRPRVPVSAKQFADAETRHSWIEQKGMMVLNFYHAQSHTDSVDVFVQEPFPFAQAHQDALVQSAGDGTVFRFVDLDRLIQMKTGTGRDKDLIDLDYLTKYGHE